MYFSKERGPVAMRAIAAAVAAVFGIRLVEKLVLILFFGG